MAARTFTTGVLVLLLTFMAGSPFSAALSAQMSASCSREMARQDAALRQYDADTQREGMTYARNEIRDAGLDVLKEKLAGNPTAEALEQSREAFQKWRDFIDQGKSHMEMMADLSRCLSVSGASGCLNEIIAKNTESMRLLGRVNDATNEWIKSLANDTISKAAERVEKARSVMQNLVSRAGNLAVGSANGALDNCMQDMERRVEARSNQTVDLRSTPTATPPASQPPSAGNSAGSSASSGGGMGGGAVAGLAAAGAGAGVGLWYLSEAQKKAQCDGLETEAYNRVNAMVNAANAISGCGSNTSCFNTRMNAFNSAFSSFNSALGNWCTCLGPNASTELTATEKATFRDMYNDMRRIGVSPGTLPACFR